MKLRFITILFLFTFMLLAGLKSLLFACEIDVKKIMLPPTSSKKVIIYDRDVGSEADLYIRQSAPRMVIHANGRVVIGDPFGYQNIEKPKKNHIKTISGKISTKEVKKLLIFLINQHDFYAMDSKTINKQTGAYDKIADASTTSLELITKKRKHLVYIYALGFSQRNSKIRAINKMKLIVQRMEKIRKKIVLNYKKSKP